jgi:hypothetical protein
LEHRAERDGDVPLHERVEPEEEPRVEGAVAQVEGGGDVEVGRALAGRPMLRYRTTRAAGTPGASSKRASPEL